MVCGPEEALGQAQRVDDVTDEHDALRLDAVQEVTQLAHARMFEAQMNVREEQGAHLAGAAVV